MTHREIIQQAKGFVKRDGHVALKWLINDYYKLSKNDNEIQGINAKMTSGIKYTNFEGHNLNDIFIKISPDYKYKLAGIIIATIGLIVAVIKMFE